MDAQQPKDMTPDEHLDLILAFCKRTLADICSKRTPGEWQVTGIDKKNKDEAYVKVRGTLVGAKFKICDCPFVESESFSEEGKANAVFITSAAGNYESALKTTIASCELAKVLCKPVGTLSFPARNFINNILAEWPVERLTK